MNTWNTHPTNKYIQFAMENPMIILLIIVFFAIMAIEELYIKPQSTPGHNKRQNKLYNELKIGKRGKVSGIIFGQVKKGKNGSDKVIYSPFDKEGHCVIFGGSGSGKSSALLIPTLNSLQTENAKNTCFVIDISGDISQNCTLKNRITYEPIQIPDEEGSAPIEHSTTPYNIFGYIDRMKTNEEKEKALSLLAHLIMPDNPNASEAGAYYNDEGRKLLTACLIAYYSQGLDFVEICDKIVSESWSNLLNGIDATKNEKAIKLINGFMGVDDRFNASAKQACEKNISLFATDEEVRASIRRPKDGEIAFEPMQVETHNCFIRIPDEQIEYLAPLTQVLTAQCLDYFKARSTNADHQILMCLDEMASLGFLDILPGLRKYRKRKIRIMCLTQALTDIDLMYSDKVRKAMMVNFKYKVILENSDPDEQEIFARLVGYDNSISLSKTGESTTYSEKREFIMEPSEFANLGNDLILLFPGGYRKLHKNFWFK